MSLTLMKNIQRIGARMHCCGSPIHDIPQLLAMFGPALAGMTFYVRRYLSKRGKCSHPEHQHKPADTDASVKQDA
jgi:hypothetical protein